MKKNRLFFVHANDTIIETKINKKTSQLTERAYSPHGNKGEKKGMKR